MATFNPPVPHEFVEPSPSDTFIWWLYKRRCIICKHPATEINEIKPRSRGKNNIQDWKNRVTLCTDCHREFHKDGVTDTKMNHMRLERIKYLVSIDRLAYA